MSVILAIATDPAVRTDLAVALERRYASDYDVVAVTGDDAGDAIARADRVAVALAPIGTPDFARLVDVTRAHPACRRLAVVAVGDTSVADELGRALTLNQVDFYVGHPWATPEEELHPIVGEALRTWTRDQQQRHEKIVVVDETRTGRGAEISSWLERNGIAARLALSDSPEGTELRSGPLAGTDLPAALLWDGRVLVAPSDSDVVEALGARSRPGRERYDVAIVGSGPAGLAAAVYAASEGLDAVVFEATTIGGQAGASAKIRNYLGFRWGVRGLDLVREGALQAEQLGAETVISRWATGLAADGDDRVLTLSSGDTVRAPCVILAGGVRYRRLDVPSVDALVGRGVFYGAAAGEAATMGGLNVVVLGGGNSAGQAAAHLAAGGAEVIVAIRGDSLAKSMSDYLVTQLSGTDNVTVRPNTQITGAVGDHQLEGLEMTDSRTGETETVGVDALFVFIGASPNTDWLDGVVEADDRGFVRTGVDGAAWLETSISGVYAAGDIRAGSIKRVAAAVGEGSTAAMLVRQRIADAAG